MWLDERGINLLNASKPERMYSHLYGKHIRPDLHRLLDLLRLDVHYHRAKNQYVYARSKTATDRKILDMIGGYGASLVGHNHDAMKKMAIALIDADTPFFVQGCVKPRATLLASLLNQLLKERGCEYYMHLYSTGAEAVEAAIAHAEAIWKKNQETRKKNISSGSNLDPIIVACRHGFHGKTRGALNITSALAQNLVPLPTKKNVLFLDTELPVNDLRQQLQPHFGQIAAFIWEPIQVEGGFRTIPKQVVALLEELSAAYGIPTIVDEIQTGSYRTGEFLHYKEAADFILLGKALGGGVAKVAACLVKKQSYLQNMGIFRSSTYAEDEFSSAMALSYLRFMKSRAGVIRAKATAFEAAIKAKVTYLQAQYPDIIKDCRGNGFLLGIEFEINDSVPRSNFMSAVIASGYLGYFLASYFLHRHNIRMAPCLSRTHVLRLEPAWLVSDEDISNFCDALEDLVVRIHCGQDLMLSSHLWRQDGFYDDVPISSPKRIPLSTPADSKVVFLSHIIDGHHLQKLDPVFACLTEHEIGLFLQRFAPLAGNIVYHEQIIQGVNGRSIHFVLQGVTADSAFFEKSFRSRDYLALNKVQAAANHAWNVGAEYVGLGQYTSIVSHNGLKLEAPQHGYITTGNSLTVALAFQGLKQLISENNLANPSIAIVGAAGNIGQVFAQLCADDFANLRLVGRTAFDPRLDHLSAELNQRGARCSVLTQPEDLVQCDVIVVATNSTAQFIEAKHLKHGAILLDLSVPSNMDASGLQARPDLQCFLGGFAKLPLNQKLISPLVPTPNGEVFGCMAETIMLGLHGHKENFSIGSLSVDSVRLSLVMAREVGIELGSLKKIAGV